MIFFQVVKNLIRPIKKTPRHLGRWNLNENNNLKIDYANIDSCGDHLCGLPSQFKKKKFVKNKQQINTI